jgi:hypothetical protein
MYATTIDRDDGFGGQFQGFIWAIVIYETANYIYVHKPITNMAHNYNNINDFINNMEDLMNIRNNYICINSLSDEEKNNLNKHPIYDLRITFDSNVNYYLESSSFKNLKTNFWKNKEKDFFKNNKMNVAVHVRRPNTHDNRIEGADTPDSYYLNLINFIRNKYKNNSTSLMFHIYSQGIEENFNDYKNNDTLLHINEDLCNTFLGLVSADILVTSASSLSYSAALLSYGEIYYKQFWHPPSKEWINCG